MVLEALGPGSRDWKARCAVSFDPYLIVANVGCAELPDLSRCIRIFGVHASRAGRASGLENIRQAHAEHIAAV